MIEEETIGNEYSDNENLAGESVLEMLTGEEFTGLNEIVDYREMINVEVVFPERPFMTTPLNDYSVTEGLLLSIFLAIVFTGVIKLMKGLFI